MYGPGVLVSALVLGLALAADAFAVSMSQGVAIRSRPHATALLLGGAFGAAQGLMPLLGWSVGVLMSAAIAAYDHWIAFGVLAFLGVKLIHEGLSSGPSSEGRRSLTGWTLAALALATSIDAAGAGLAFDAMGLGPMFAALVIAAVTAVVCGGGVYLGHAIGARLGPAAECVGGAALVAIGVKILWDHGALSF